jgi:hypothetical protein
MMAQVTAARWCPSSRHSRTRQAPTRFPTSANREDHVSMSMGARSRPSARCTSRRASSRSRACSRARRSICWRRSQPRRARAGARARAI